MAWLNSRRRAEPNNRSGRSTGSAAGRALAAVPAVVLAVGLSLLGGETGQAHVCAPDPEVGVGGVLLLPNASGLAQVSLPGREVRPLAIPPGSGVVNHVARSADGSKLAVARFSRPAGDPVGGSDILVVGPDGGPPLVTIPRREPGELLGSPAWLPDGGLLFERQSLTGAGGSRLERVDADGGNRRLVLERAASPAVSPDGRLLAFVRSDGTDRLLVRALEGGPERVVVDDPGLPALYFPRFSPDGSWLAFGAAGDGTAGGLPMAPRGLDLGSWQLGARPALAHGVPADVWLVRAEGGGQRRLTSFFDDDPAPAWSPDGRWILVFGGESVKIVSTEGPASYCVLGTGGYGGVEWY